VNSSTPRASPRARAPERLALGLRITPRAALRAGAGIPAGRRPPAIPCYAAASRCRWRPRLGRHWRTMRALRVSSNRAIPI